MTVDDEFVARFMAVLRKMTRDDEKVFKFGPDAFRAVWRRSLDELGLSWVGPPHTLRHSGPSADVASGRRSLEEIRRRGRWLQMKSVQRYSKAHALTMHLARLPAGLKERGRMLMDNFANTFVERLAVCERSLAAPVTAALEPMLRRDSRRGAGSPVSLRAVGRSQGDSGGRRVGGGSSRFCFVSEV